MGSQIDNQEKFIIVETNFRVYAKTENQLWREILKLFVTPKYSFRNMFYGLMEKDSVERAFKKGITATQILGFLRSHSI